MIAVRKFQTALRLARDGQWHTVRRRLRSYFAEHRLRRARGKPFTNHDGKAIPVDASRFIVNPGALAQFAPHIRALLAYAS